MKNSFYGELGHVLDKFLKQHMKILLGEFNAKVGSEIFLNQQEGMRVYTKLLIIIELE
jgi:hypothetical protein